MKLNRRSLLAGCAGSVAGLMMPGSGIAAAARKLVKPAIWKMEIETLSTSMPVQNPTVGVKSAAGKTVLTLPVTERGFRDTALNASGRRIWNLCDGRHTVKQIAEDISRNFDIEVEQAYVDCMAFLFHLKMFNAILV